MRIQQLDFMICSFIRIILFLTTQAVSSTQDDIHYVQNFDPNAGLYFDKVTDVKLYNDRWRLIAFVDLRQLTEEFDLISYYARNLQLNCNKKFAVGKFVCENQHFLELVVTHIEELVKKRNLLNDLIGSNEYSRTKRGVFNFIGSISKILFGTLDESDAEYYNDQIDEVYANNDKIASLLQNQTSVVESFVYTVNRTITDIETKSSIFQGRISQLERVVNETLRRIRLDELQIEMNAHVIELDSLTNRYENRVETLINAVMLAFKGLIHPELLSPTQLTTILSELKPAIRATLDYPAPLNAKNAMDIISVSEINIFYSNNRLIYTVHIPLVEIDEFEAFQLIPIPKHIQNDSYVYIHPSKKYIISSQNRQKSILLDDLADQECKHLRNRRICLQQQPFYSVHTHKSCETDLLITGSTIIEKNCDVRLLRSEVSTWTKINRRNSWLFVAVKTEAIDILCAGKTTHHLFINGSGIITLPPHCKAWSSSIELISQNLGFSNCTLPYSDIVSEIPWNDLKKEILSNRTEKITEFIPKVYNKPNIQMDDLNLFSVKLSEIRRQAETLRHKKRQIHLIGTHQNYIWYIFYVIGIILALCFFFNRFCCRMYISIFEWICWKKGNSTSELPECSNENRNVSRNSAGVDRYESQMKSSERSIQLQQSRKTSKYDDERQKNMDIPTAPTVWPKQGTFAKNKVFQIDRSMNGISETAHENDANDTAFLKYMNARYLSHVRRLFGSPSTPYVCYFEDNICKNDEM